jgi:hypothetical protein
MVKHHIDTMIPSTQLRRRQIAEKLGKNLRLLEPTSAISSEARRSALKLGRDWADHAGRMFCRMVWISALQAIDRGGGRGGKMRQEKKLIKNFQ